MKKDEARPLFGVGALYSIQCFDTVGWVREWTMDIRPQQVEEGNRVGTS